MSITPDDIDGVEYVFFALRLSRMRFSCTRFAKLFKFRLFVMARDSPSNLSLYVKYSVPRYCGMNDHKSNSLEEDANCSIDSA